MSADPLQQVRAVDGPVGDLAGQASLLATQAQFSGAGAGRLLGRDILTDGE